VRRRGGGDKANLGVVVAAPDNRTLGVSGLRYELLRIESRYQWYRQSGRWEYEPVKSTQRVADGRLDVAADAPGRITLAVGGGRYRREVSSGEANALTTSVTFDAGWYSDASADTPDVLELALDKPEYRPGETINVAVTARTTGRVTLNVIGDRLLTSSTTDVQPGIPRMRVSLGRDWGNGAYMVATLRRPLDQAAKRMPGRAIGVQWFAIDRKARRLALDMKLPTLVR